MPMRLLAFVLALAAPLLGAAPASAADVTTLDCVVKQMPASLRVDIVADVNRQIAAEAADPDPALLTPLKAVAESCQRVNGWSDAATKAAAAYLHHSTALVPIIDAMQAHGIDSLRVLGIYHALPESVRSRRLDEDTMRGVIEKVVDAGMIDDREEALLLGRAIAYANLIDISRHEFIAA